MDLLLLLAMVGGYVSVMSVAAFYLGGTFVPIILLANLTNLLCHLPAIRDRPCPPPRDHRQSLAFHVKAMCHTIVSSARYGHRPSCLLCCHWPRGSWLLARRAVAWWLTWCWWWWSSCGAVRWQCGRVRDDPAGAVAGAGHAHRAQPQQ